MKVKKYTLDTRQYTGADLLHMAISMISGDRKNIMDIGKN